MNKEQLEAAFKDVQRQYQRGELPIENDPTASWPLDKYSVYVFNDKDGGPELLEVYLEHCGALFEELVDTATKLDDLHFPHIAKILRKVAESARSELDDIIEDKVPPYYRDVTARRRERIVYWLYQRMKATAQSWNALVELYSLAKDGWVEFREPDIVCEGGKWREIPPTNGVGTVRLRWFWERASPPRSV
jgi:hypothetical protein